MCIIAYEICNISAKVDSQMNDNDSEHIAVEENPNFKYIIGYDTFHSSNGWWEAASVAQKAQVAFRSGTLSKYFCFM